jgi:hypothetical protein
MAQSKLFADSIERDDADQLLAVRRSIIIERVRYAAAEALEKLREQQERERKRKDRS